MEKKFADARLADHIQQNSDALAEIASILEENSNTLSEPSPLETQSAMKEQGSIEQLLKIVDSAKMFLAQHISDGQLYQEETLSQEKALFDIRTCDKNWIRELKQAHNLLVQTKDVLSAY